MTPKPLRILVSGGTGFLGKRVLPLLARIGETTTLTRTPRLAGQLKADLTLWDGGLEPESLAHQFDLFLHMAALYDLRAGAVELMKQNVAATHNALVLAQKAKIPHFVHISTVAVTVGENGQGSDEEFTRAGRNTFDPLITPDMLDTSRAFPDDYAKSKAHAEHLVKYWPSADFASRLVLRLGILTGDTQTGTIERLDGPYHAAHFLEKKKGWIEKLPGAIPLPGIPGRTIPLLPVDTAANAIVRLIEISREQNWTGQKSLHLFPSEGVGAQELFESALRYLGYENRRVRLISQIPKPILKELGKWLGEIPREEIEYLLSMPRHDTRETEALLGDDWYPHFSDYEETFWKGYRDYVQNR